MPPVSVTIFASDPGTYFLEDDGIPGNNFSRIRFPNGTVVSFEHPTNDLFFAPSAAGITLVINLTDTLGTSNFSTGSFTDPLATPDAILVNSLRTTAGVTLISNGSITENGADAAADIRAATLILSAQTGIGAAINALETQVGTIEAETVTGGISLANFGTVSIGGLTAQVDGLDVLTSGNLTFTNFGAIVLSDDSGPETIHGGTTSGNVTLIANGVDSDIISNIDQDSISAPRGNITVTAGRDIGFGLIGANFDNDVRANGNIVITAGRDFLMDGFADMVSDDFGQSTGGNVIVTAGRNIAMLAVAGTDAGITASGTAGANVILTTGPGGTLTLNSGNGTAPFASLISNSGDIFVNADRISIGTNGAISTPDGSTFLRPRTDGWGIDLGSATDVAFALELSDAELDRIFTPTLTIGALTAGQLAVTAPISPLNALNLTLTSGNDVAVQSSITVGNALVLRAADNVFSTAPTTILTGGAVSVFVDAAGDDIGTGGTSALNGTVTATAILINGNVEADILDGSAANDNINGDNGNDTLRGLGGDDTLDGGLGLDTLVGGLGNDSFVVDSSGDVVIEAFGEGTDIIRSVFSYVLPDGVFVETLATTNSSATTALNLTGNNEINNIQGNNGVNTLSGGGGADIILGFGGNDTLNGGVGVDTLNGGLGDDNFFVDNIDDLAIEASGEGLDSVITSVTYVLREGASFQVERLFTTDANGVSAIDLTGNSLVNNIQGNDGVNNIDGKAGSDVLVGNGGADTFRFTTTLSGTNIDTVIDFEVGIDELVLENAVFFGLAAGPLAAGAFNTGAAATQADDRIIYNPASGALIFDQDGNGAGAAVQFAILTPGLAVTASDFTVI